MSGPSAADTARHIGDIGSLGVILATVANWLPSIASLLSIIWVGIRIYETRTVQALLRRKAITPDD